MAPTRGVRLLLLGSVSAVLLCVAGAAWWMSPGEDLAAWRQGPPPHAWAALERQEARWREEGMHRRVESRYVPLSEISPDLQVALLVGEDINYFGHGAVDFGAVWEAIREGTRVGGRFRGASTISQQLAKTLFLSGERSLWRKAKEARLAWWMERRLGKRRILELYLNVVEFGPGYLGVEAAARHYYGVGAAAVGPDRAAGLAAAIPSPGRDNPATDTPRWRFRQATILRRMAHALWLRGQLASWSGKARS
ncbi:MAG: monofunctional biosynthetic peptidoglycan transglycosylase [Acidobacteria bacterium]|nr:MAG: monofunctional biosynthetic peptidoglycan transglycosylase [Acidobacteriota bacterium]